jgi:hypothetical protein
MIKSVALKPLSIEESDMICTNTFKFVCMNNVNRENHVLKTILNAFNKSMRLMKVELDVET